MFALFAVTVNDEHTKPRFKRKSSGSIQRQHMLDCVLSFGSKATGVLVILLSQDGFEWDCPETKF